jgi:RimJ/RimL family protein N-acetyltransferase
MNHDLFQGEQVRLTAFDAEADPDSMSHWSRDTGYWRLASSAMALPRLARHAKESIQKMAPDENWFAIRPLGERRIIGSTGLYGIRWTHGEAWAGISIGERAYWGRGYGTDAMRLLLRYAFTELNLVRISLNVLSDNPRAIRSYQKAGFVIEGKARNAARYNQHGRDETYMGILRDE